MYKDDNTKVRITYTEDGDTKITEAGPNIFSSGYDITTLSIEPFDTLDDALDYIKDKGLIITNTEEEIE